MNEEPIRMVRGDRLVHFDLGKIGKAEAELRAVAGFLITNEVITSSAARPSPVNS